MNTNLIIIINEQNKSISINKCTLRVKELLNILISNYLTKQANFIYYCKKFYRK